MKNNLFIILVFLGIALFFQSEAQVNYMGVNLAGAEFGDGNLPGNYNQHYTYPTEAEVDYFTTKGMNVFRLPFRWERLQHEPYEALNSAELSRIKNFVSYANSKEAAVILDPHNYARYYDAVIGSEALPDSAFGDFWKRLALEFKENSNVIFGLMNEPHSMKTETWLDAANTAIDAIRSVGANNLILIPGNGYSGAHSWSSNWYGTPNSQVMRGVIDPANNYAFEVHQYFDSNSSGSSETCVSTAVGADRLKSFTKWLRDNDERGFLGEFGISSNETCMQALDNMLGYIESNADVWLGWTYWAAGPWWGNYIFSIEPENEQDKPQMSILQKYLDDFSSSTQQISDSEKNYSLAGNFPNPFFDSTVIEFSLPESSHVNLTIYNIDGKQIVTLLNKKITAGDHQFTWNRLDEQKQKVPGGLYFCHLKMRSEEVQVIKMAALPEE